MGIGAFPSPNFLNTHLLAGLLVTPPDSCWGRLYGPWSQSAMWLTGLGVLLVGLGQTERERTETIAWQTLMGQTPLQLPCPIGSCFHILAGPGAWHAHFVKLEEALKEATRVL
jgi:hypothetical protein